MGRSGDPLWECNVGAAVPAAIAQRLDQSPFGERLPHSEDSYMLMW